MISYLLIDLRFFSTTFQLKLDYITKGGFHIAAKFFFSPMKGFSLPMYASALADVSVLAEPYEQSPIRFKGDARVSTYLDISATEDADVLESSSVGGNQKSNDSSLSSSTTCSVSNRPSILKSTSDCEDLSKCSHCSDDSVASISD